jgi:hypothetical protein
VQFILIAFGTGLTRSWKAALVLMVLQIIVISALLTWIALKKSAFPELIYCDGQWALKQVNDSTLRWIKPLPQSSIFPICLVLVYQKEGGRKQRLFIWEDVVGQEAYRQLCRQLNQYFFLVRKSQSSH